MIEKTGQVVIGKTKCCACENTSTKLINGHPGCEDCAEAIAKHMATKEASVDSREVMFPK